MFCGLYNDSSGMLVTSSHKSIISNMSLHQNSLDVSNLSQPLNEENWIFFESVSQPFFKLATQSVDEQSQRYF